MAFSLDEAGIIDAFFSRHQHDALSDVRVGVGDDASVLKPSRLDTVCTVDALVCGQHFFEDARPYDLGHKCLAVSLSDVAAMGAVPKYVWLSVVSPPQEASWWQAFSDGFFALADAHGVRLIGGNMARGPLALHTTVQGEVPSGCALLRSGAKLDDGLYVSGVLGAAARGLSQLKDGRHDDAEALAAQCRPEPRVALGKALGAFAHAAMDLSDGLACDLKRLLKASKVGAVVDWDALPWAPGVEGLPKAARTDLALFGGEDYELCFTVPPERQDQVRACAKALGLPLTRIGRIVAGRSLEFRDKHGRLIVVSGQPWDPFHELR
jgi:thiamine-monophosphate kinase